MQPGREDRLPGQRETPSGAARLYHEFAPLFAASSEILVLGSFPSVKSREQQFYYGHPQNRFWPLVARIFGEEMPSAEEAPDLTEWKKRLILSHGLALWDVIESCEIRGSSDSSIRGAVPNDLPRILDAAPIRRICLNGKTAARLFDRYQREAVHGYGIPDGEILVLPSTSPANAAWSLPRLEEAWRPALTVRAGDRS